MRVILELNRGRRRRVGHDRIHAAAGRGKQKRKSRDQDERQPASGSIRRVDQRCLDAFPDVLPALPELGARVLLKRVQTLLDGILMANDPVNALVHRVNAFPDAVDPLGQPPSVAPISSRKGLGTLLDRDDRVRDHVTERLGQCGGAAVQLTHADPPTVRVPLTKPGSCRAL